jgi:addiction module HigA family antidote
MSVKIHHSIAVHPGEWLRTEIIEARGLNVTDAAARLGMSRDGLGDLLGGRVHLSADMANRFENAFGVKVDTLMRMQTAYDSARQAERR